MSGMLSMLKAMVITVASYKGGVGKSTTAIHLTAYLQKKSPTVLIDGDPNRSVCGWAVNGNLPFEIIHLHQSAKFARNYEHAVIDTSARLEPEEIKDLVEVCDLLVIPSTPDALSLQALLMTTAAIENVGAGNYRILADDRPTQAEPRRRGNAPGTPRKTDPPFQDPHPTFYLLSKSRIGWFPCLRCQRPPRPGSLARLSQAGKGDSTVSTPFGKVLENFGKLPAEAAPKTSTRKATTRPADPRQSGAPARQEEQPGLHSGNRLFAQTDASRC